ncbi:eIF-2-alpha kinase GCN2 [Neodiprion virginianus]|uniref:eIF-2-alpha kinase GCN2 n=1 Tax=Neodiprion virginianus TaxID=2961670 RepID=UPI001EE77192|nr:eIF-2-alpha kinase GCN2 [Neodiprion virginianus]
MSHAETNRDRQQNELEVLKSIFAEELHDHRKTKGKKKWQPLDLSITLTPQKGMSGPAEVYAQIDLQVICRDNYPEEVPRLLLRNSRGLSNQQVGVLYSDLEQMADQLKGQEMIYELAQHVQKFLHDHNKPGYSSFYEEMVSRQQEKLKFEIQKKQLKEDKERQVLQDEIQKRQEALMAEVRKRKELARLTSETDSNCQSIPSSPPDRPRRYSRRRCTSTSESSESCLCEHKGTKLVKFSDNRGERVVCRGKCLGHSTKGSVVYVGLDTTSGELLAIAEWSLRCGTTESLPETHEATDLQHCLKQIAVIEQELNHLNKLHHPNLVHYLHMKYIQDKESVVIYVLQEFVVGTTCSFFLTENIPMDVDTLRHLATGVLSALQYLHHNNVVHKDLRETSVHIDSTGVVKLSGYSLDKRLSDIYCASYLAKNEHEFPTIQGRGGKKADIHRFGVLLLSLLRGSIVSENEIDMETNLQTDLKDFLSKCLVHNERIRWSAEQLQGHCFIRVPIERGLSPPCPDRKKEQNSSETELPAADIHPYSTALGSQSRIQSEFEVLKWLGKGAFGDVLKVKNKLDGGIYAIKRIELNPKNIQLNRKITREVKLLSRLNHENVVRYYNSWIESATIDDSSRHSQLTPAATPSNRTAPERGNNKDELMAMESNDIERLAPPLHDVEWNISYQSRASGVLSGDSDAESEDSSSDSDDEDWAFLTRTRIDSSNSIEFEKNESSQTSNSTQDVLDSPMRHVENTNDSAVVKEIQFMYIQMEFCEKSTLRTAIDNSLCEDEERVWRLFREIVEGLAHIHQQGMIHRDLKPVNIFLDSNDHVKIGDFGLATSNILSTLAHNVDTDKELQLIAGTSFDLDDVGSMTGQVGTALYTAPELSSKVAKAIYNQKVDIYSLGIILFEMCYKPLDTGMERVKVLLNLRSREIILPPEFTEIDMPHHVHLLRWLLNHDPSQRPTSQELLTSEYLPPPQLEEAELQEMVRHTLSNRQSKAYKYLIESCMAQKVTPAEDITYDMNLPSRGFTSCPAPKIQFLQENVKSKVIEVFQRHGGVCLGSPLLMPKSNESYMHMDSCVKLMTRTGSVVSLPHDLRAPFARYVAWNNIMHVRRYAIERVYREKKVHGFHPRELYECAFDIISPTPGDLMDEAELILIVSEIANEIPQLRERNFSVRLNHTSLLQAVLMYCGIEREKYHDIYSILCDARDGKFSKFQLQTHLISLCLTDQAMETLYNLFETESSVAKIASVLRTITRRKGNAAILAKEGLRELEIVIANTEALGLKWPIVVVPLLVHNIQQHSGVIYQISCELKKRRRRGGQDVIAAGGRYDKMLTSFRQFLERTGMAGKEVRQYGVGISISLDKLVCAVRENCKDICSENKFGVDVAVCCIGGMQRREKEKAEVLRELWSQGLKVTSLGPHSAEEISEYCRDNSINYIILLRDGENGTLRVQSWEKDRYQERKINTQDITDFLQRQIDNPLPILTRSESKVSTGNNEVPVSSYNPVKVNIGFVLSEKDKLSASARRSVKNTILAQMTSVSQRISHKIPIEVFAVFLDTTVVKTIISFLDIDENEVEFHKSIQLIIEKHPRHKTYITDICEDMRETRNDKLHPVLILYSLIDNKYRILM